MEVNQIDRIKDEVLKVVEDHLNARNERIKEVFSCVTTSLNLYKHEMNELLLRFQSVHERRKKIIYSWVLVCTIFVLVMFTTGCSVNTHPAYWSEESCEYCIKQNEHYVRVHKDEMLKLRIKRIEDSVSKIQKTLDEQKPTVVATKKRFKSVWSKG
jgi:hypothetical protein